MPLSISFSGKGEVQTLTAAESLSLIKFYDTNTWLCGNYINELLIKLLHRHDAHESLFDAYGRIIAMIEQSQGMSELMLRQFETFALNEIGYGIVFENDVRHQPIDVNSYYEYHADLGAQKLQFNPHTNLLQRQNVHLPCVSGSTLSFLSAKNVFFAEAAKNKTSDDIIAINNAFTELLNDQKNDQITKQLQLETKQLLRYIIQRVLEWRQLKSRAMFIDVKKALQPTP